jgi:Ca2+-binding RTX toxin-like protein
LHLLVLLVTFITNNYGEKEMATQRLTSTSGSITDGTTDSDTWTITSNKLNNPLEISGSTSSSGTDYTLNKSNYYKGLSDTTDDTKISTANSYLGTVNAEDAIVFQKTGDFTNLTFTGIEKIKLAEGVSIVLAAESIENNVNSLEYADGAYNAGMHFYGTSGGKAEKVTFEVEGENQVAIDMGSDDSYDGKSLAVAALELDDAETGNLAHDGVQLSWDFRDAFDGINADYYYTRVDGTNNADYILGSEKGDYFTTRLGDDVVYSGKGNDIIVSAGGADKVSLGAGDDIYLITGFRGLAGNGDGKTSTGEAQWVAGDVVDGGSGWDVFRVSAGARDNDIGNIVLSSDSFKNMEEVQVGAAVSRALGESSEGQKAAGHFYHKANAAQVTATSGVAIGESYDNVVIDASLLSSKLKFTGNGNANTFIGTSGHDSFYGNGGHDILTGGNGKDSFYFGTSHAKTGTDYDDAVGIAFSSSDSDVITDFVTGKDKIYLDKDTFDQFSAVGKINAATFASNLEITGFDNDGDEVNDSIHLTYKGDLEATSDDVEIADLIGITNLSFKDVLIYDGTPV